MQNTLLFVVSVIFALSLLGAFVLFRFLKSSAIIKRKEYQAGGALAGFLLIFGALYASYSQLEVRATERQDLLWTIVGEVRLEDDALDSAEVEVSLLPPTPKTLSAPGGGFRFNQIGVAADDVLELQLELSGYTTESLLLDEEVADFDENRKRITLKGPVLLARRGAAPPVGLAPPNPDAGTLSGRVLKFFRKRSPLSGARVELRAPETEEAVHQAFSDSAGNYSFRDVAPGQYDLGVRLGSQVLDVIAPSPASVSMEARQNRQLIITVRMQEGG